MRLIPFEPRYRDDMIFMVLEAKNALGCIPSLNEDLLDIPAHYTQQGGAFFLALSDSDRVIGCIGVQINERSARLHRFYVKCDLKRQGIGSQLLFAAEAFAAAHGAEEAVVHMGDQEHYWESAFFYPKHGYVQTEPRWMKKRLVRDPDGNLLKF